MAAYTHFRFIYTVSSTVFANAVRITGFSDDLPDAENLLVGGEATASSANSSDFTPENAFEEGTSAWFPSGKGGSGNWIQYKLPSPVDIGFFRILCRADHIPSALTIRGSNDGVKWDYLAMKRNINTTESVFNFKQGIRFRARDHAGAPIKRMHCWDWETGELLFTLQPGADYSSVILPSGAMYGLTFIGASGDKPVTHGPYSF